MTGWKDLLSNYKSEDHGRVKFGGSQRGYIRGHGNLILKDLTVYNVYYVEGLNHNLFSIGKFIDAGLKVTFL
jgi:hypothetical protein